jgi:hypothetical protein
MTFVKRLLIAVTLIIFLVIIWRLIIIRINLKNDMVEGFNPITSLFSSSTDAEVSSLESTSKVTLGNADGTAGYYLPLKEVCIKASFNSASSGNYISPTMLQYVISRGVRFLDFEVFYISSDGTENGVFKPMVATSTDPTFMALSSENSVLLDTILTSAVANAFSSPCPNYSDPLFINLRIKSNNPDIYKAVAASIDSSIKNKIYVNQDASASYIANNMTSQKAMRVTKDTTLEKIGSHVVLSIDKTIFPNYVNYCSCDGSTADHCYDLTKYTNIESGSENLQLILYNYLSPVPTIQLSDTAHRTSVKTLTMTIPDNLYLINKANNNPNYSDCILRYGCQLAPYRFYQNDGALEKYETFFNDHRSAFVPLASAITYYINK